MKVLGVFICMLLAYSLAHADATPRSPFPEVKLLSYQELTVALSPNGCRIEKSLIPWEVGRFSDCYALLMSGVKVATRDQKFLLFNRIAFRLGTDIKAEEAASYAKLIAFAISDPRQTLTLQVSVSQFKVNPELVSLPGLGEANLGSLALSYKQILVHPDGTMSEDSWHQPNILGSPNL